jgi:hypothetical protein
MSKDQVHPPRGLATVTYNGLAVVGLAALTLVGASGSASASPRETEGARPASASARSGEPPAATRAEARRTGRRLLALAVLPPGTHRFTGKRVPAVLRHPSQTIAADAYADVHHIFAGNRSMRAVLAFLRHHHPKGMTQTGTGELGLRGHAIEKEVDYSPRHLPAGFQEIDFLVEVVRGQHGHADLRTDVELVWYPPRSAAEHLAAGHFRAVKISAVIYGKGVRQEHRTFRQQAIIDKLTRVLNAAPASPGGWESCPAIFESYTLTFIPVKGEAGAKVQVPGCFQYRITVGGHAEPPLADTGKIENIAHHLLKRQTSNPVAPGTSPVPAE